MTATYDDYKFFPIFLLVGYTGYLVNKFKDWMVNCHTVQARIHDIGVLVGGAIMTPDEPAAREKVFEVYRLLNLIHVLTYMDHTIEFCHFNYKHLVQLGLMSNVEFELIAPYREGPNVEFEGVLSPNRRHTKNKVRDMTISWLNSELMNLIQDRIVHDTYAIQISSNVAGLRGVCARHHDMFLRDNPNVYLSTMLLTCDYLLIMIIIGMPLATCIYVPGQEVTIFQWTTLGCVFMLLSAFMLSHALANVLRDPFLTKHGSKDVTEQTGMKLDDLIDCRALLHSTDCCIFAQLRANFDRRRMERVMKPHLQPIDGDLCCENPDYCKCGSLHSELQPELRKQIVTTLMPEKVVTTSTDPDNVGEVELTRCPTDNTLINEMS